MIKVVIFDCFGVLTEDGWLAFERKYQTPENSEELRYINHQADRGLMQYAALLAEACRLTGAERSVAHRMISSAHHPNEGVFDIVRKLKKDGYILGIISNAAEPLTNRLSEELISLFDFQTLSYQVAAIKPEPAIYEAFLRQAGVDAEETIFIDDREANSEGARRVGMQAITYQSSERLLKELQAHGVKIEHKK